MVVFVLRNETLGCQVASILLQQHHSFDRGYDSQRLIYMTT